MKIINKILILLMVFKLDSQASKALVPVESDRDENFRAFKGVRKYTNSSSDNSEFQIEAPESSEIVIGDSEDILSIISRLPRRPKQIHIFSQISHESLSLNQIIQNFFDSEIDTDKLFLIKKIICQPLNIGLKNTINVESVLIERRLKQNKILIEDESSKEFYSGSYNELTRSIDNWRKIERKQKDSEQTRLVREFGGTR